MFTIGFTGTRNGMTVEQRSAVESLIRAIAVESLIRATCEVFGLHGDCIGADADFDAICRERGIPTQCRPCTFPNMRANTGAEQIAEPAAPMQRNRAIVAAADVMIACPPNTERIKQGSGTWATIGFAEKAGKPLHVVFPDGSTR